MGSGKKEEERGNQKREGINKLNKIIKYIVYCQSNNKNLLDRLISNRTINPQK